MTALVLGLVRAVASMLWTVVVIFAVGFIDKLGQNVADKMSAKP